MLGNLSPDSTLAALQATETITSGAAQEDALTSSIADATPAEREIGIRAAFAAQKLRGWRNEVSRWKWPGKQERGFGLGFIPPPKAPENGAGYRGCLPVTLAEKYEARLEEIKDDLDSLDINEIRSHVLEAHRPSSNSVKSKPIGARGSYGRMRDFTALITATVIQALPDLAKLNALLDTWDIRLRVLRELPRYFEVMQSAQSGLRHAFNDIRSPDISQNLTEHVLDNQKLELGGQVSDMGRRIDRLLDMLEGHDDTLPQAWIDRLEKVELDYATWVVEAQHLALKNQMVRDPEKVVQRLPHISEDNRGVVPGTGKVVEGRSSEASDPGTQAIISELPVPPLDEPKAKLKPDLKLDLAQPKGHKREISRVSVADSTYSTFSDISNAEIVDAKSTSVLPSPKVYMVESPFRASRDELTWFGSSPAAEKQMTTKPPMLQRASTASIEVFAKEKLKEVVLKRSASWDMVSQLTHSPDGIPSKALGQLTSSASGVQDFAHFPTTSSIDTTPLAPQPLEIRSLQSSSRREVQPDLPRRSSKRNTLSGMSPITPTQSIDAVEIARQLPPTLPPPERKPTNRQKEAESLDDKIQDLLTTLPTKIRLAKNADSVTSSSSTTRASTPTPGLTLSPAKADPTNRKGSLGDPEIRLYHLTTNGQGREAPPVKLFVRTVGDGGRVMVRVGGGWADLGEYLKEYSLHHGSRATDDGRLEVARFPASSQAAVINSVLKARNSTSPAATHDTDLVNPKARALVPRVGSPERRSGKREVTPPPVPAIPSSYAPRATSASHQGVVTNVVHANAEGPGMPSQRYTTTSPNGVTTTTVITPPVISTNYTPLGGAGPKMNNRRSATFAATPNKNDAWVQGMVGKARAVSGGGPTIVQSANGTSTTITTTTTVSSTPPSSSRRASSYFGLTPNNSTVSPMTISTSPSAGSVASSSKNSPRSSYAGSRKSSRMSLTDIGGIKRVFLRKKSDTGAK